MYLNLFKAGQAEPLRQRRIWQPPILWRLSVGNAARLPTAIRRDVSVMGGGIFAVYPPEHPAPLPGNLRAIAGRLLSRFRAFLRAIALTFAAQCPRTTTGITGTVAGQSPVSFPSYARR